MSKMKITPDVELATKEAIQIRIAYLQKELSSAHNPVDTKVLMRRVKALQDRLGIGPVENTASKASLLLSKKDLE